jgi:hypothetical protein
MTQDRTKSEHHDTIRLFLRIAGPIVLSIGLIFLIIGLGSFFAAFGSFEPPRYFWCAFVGMPLIVVGMGLCKLGYLGLIYRYIAAETTPVARDTINDLGEGIGPGVKAVTKAMAEGFDEARRKP